MSCPFLKDCIEAGPICNVCEVYGPIKEEPIELNHTFMKNFRTEHISSKVAKISKYRLRRRINKPSQITHHIKQIISKEKEVEYPF